jgi:hypothetical protein
MFPRHVHTTAVEILGFHSQRTAAQLRHERTSPAETGRRFQSESLGVPGAGEAIRTPDPNLGKVSASFEYLGDLSDFDDSG